MRNLETKSDVFYVRCRPSTKVRLQKMMEQDNFKSMADWFDQFVNSFNSKETSGKTRRKTK